MVIEFSNRFQQYWVGPAWYQTLAASYGFLQTLKPEDYVAVVAYDMKSEILSDFSTDKRKAYEAMQRLRIPGFSESNLYDALTDTADRMTGIEGRKAIVLIASGIDTFSKLTFDKARKALQDAGVPIYAIGLMQALRDHGTTQHMGAIAAHGLPAGRQPDAHVRQGNRRHGLLPALLRRVPEHLPADPPGAAQPVRRWPIRPPTRRSDGKFRKIKVELVNPATNEPLRIVDEKGSRSSTRSSPRPATRRRAKWSKVKPSKLSCLQFDAESLTLQLHLCYPRTVP